MKILLNDKMQFATGVPDAIITPALSDTYTDAVTFTATFSEDEVMNCVGIGYTDATEIEIYAPNLDPTELEYKFDSDSSDTSRNGNDGTDTDMSYVDGKAVFNGTSSFINTNYKMSEDSWEIVIKFNLSSFYAPQTLIGSPASKSIILAINTSGKFDFYLSYDGSSWDGFRGNIDAGTLNIDTEYFMTLTFTGTQYILRFENNIIMTLTDSNKINQLDLVLGRWGGTYYLDGSMSSARIFDRPLTDAQRTNGYENDIWPAESTALRTVPITKSAPYQNGLYTFDKFESDKFEITHNGSYIGRVGMGEYRTIGTSPSKETGFYTTTESRMTLSGQVIAGAGGYSGRRQNLDTRYKITEDMRDDIKTAYTSQISKMFPYFLCLDDEQHILSEDLYYFYASTDKPISMLQGSTRQALWSYKFKFYERF